MITKNFEKFFILKILMDFIFRSNIKTLIVINIGVMFLFYILDNNNMYKNNVTV